MRGMVKSFSRLHGFGFIASGKEDVFFHIKDWMGDSDPEVGEEVDFIWHESEKGLKATRIRRIDDGK